MIERLQFLGLSPEAQALAQGMLLGDRSALDPSLTAAMRTAGMSHMLAVSGLHVGILMSVVWMLYLPFQWLVMLAVPQRMWVYRALSIVKRLLVVCVTAAYVWRIGAPASAVRAAVMLSLVMMGWLVQRRSSPWRSLIFAALVLLAWDPWSLASPGFQLSFLAVAGILLFRPWLTSPQVPRWLQLLLLSVAAQWLTAPVVAYWFHQVPLLGWLQGLLAVPLLPVFVTLVLTGLVFPSWHWLALPIDAIAAWLHWVADAIGNLECWLLGGHLYFYPTIFEAFVAELLLLAVVGYFRLRGEETK